MDILMPQETMDTLMPQEETNYTVAHVSSHSDAFTASGQLLEITANTGGETTYPFYHQNATADASLTMDSYLPLSFDIPSAVEENFQAEEFP